MLVFRLIPFTKESFGLGTGAIVEVLLVFRAGLSWLKIVYASDPSFRPDIIKLILITYSVSDRRPWNVVLNSNIWYYVMFENSILNFTAIYMFKL